MDHLPSLESHSRQYSRMPQNRGQWYRSEANTMTMMSASHIILYADHISGMLKKVMAGERGFHYPCSDTTFVIHNCAINFVTDVTNNVTFTCKL